MIALPKWFLPSSEMREILRTAVADRRVFPLEQRSVGFTASTMRDHLSSCPIPELGMRVGLGPGDTPVFKPSVQFGIAFKLRSRHEEPPPDNADLVLDLSLLPALGRGAGDRIDQVMSSHLLEPAIVGAGATDKDRIYRRLRVHCPRTNGGQLPLS